MSDDFLKQRLQRVARRYQWLGLWRKLAVWWALAALVAGGFLLLHRTTGWASPHLVPIGAALAIAAALGIALHHFLKVPNPRWVARQIENKHPELNGILITAVQQSGNPEFENSYLHYRVVREATARSQDADWRQVVPDSRLALVQVAHLSALALFVVAFAALRVEERPDAPGESWVKVDGVQVTPGDASIERGESLVVLARFGDALPASVNLIVRQSGATPRQIPLTRSLADPVFGGSVAEVSSDFTYQLEYRGQRTREFNVKVYEHPRLVRSDVELTFPDYTQLGRKRVEDTRRVSAVEGTKLDLTLQLNKPVKSAKLVARDASKAELPLVANLEQPSATLSFVPEKSQTYELQLVDAEGRPNKVALPFVFDVQPNRAPEVRLASPRGDVRPSAIEEVGFEGTVWDDFGAGAYGLAYSVGGGEPKFIELGRGLPAKEKREFRHILSLEELGAKPDDLIAWHAWADDVGPDGKPRRTMGDLFFAEVRPFDEIFRESQDMQSPDSDQQQGGQGNQARQLTELQKQIINATWKLQRDGATPKYADDVKVVTESQQQALAQAAAGQQQAQGPREQAMWRAATQEMETAIDRLKDAAKDPKPLAQALPAEQAAYQALLKLQAREMAITRSQRQRGGGGGQEANQRMLDQLDLQQAENRYETQRQARAPQNRERQEQLAVMNRLQQLAQRQQDLNERLREMQMALQEAKTEAEREEIRRRLKRLEEEQRQMLADVDELRQRMDRPENQSAMTQERRQLEQTREDVQRAAEATGDGSVSQALASGTRAQRQLQELRDEMRKQNSSQFAEDLREMRQQARDLSRQQEELSQQIEALGNAPTQRRSLSDASPSQQLLDQLQQQQQRMSELMDRATQISEQSENTEPLLSRQLYDSIRKVSQADETSVKQARDDLLSSGLLTFDMRDRLEQAGQREGGGKALEVTREMLRDGAVRQAARAGQRAQGGIDELKRGVERAAESVLGDDVEQLRLAQSELDALTDQLQREVAQSGQAGESQQGQRQPGSAAGEQPGEQRMAGGGQRRDAADQQGSQSGGSQRGEQSGQPGERGEQLAQGGQQGQQPGEQGGRQGGGGQRESGQRGESESPRLAGGQRGGESSSGERGGPEAQGEESGTEPRAGERRGETRVTQGRGGAEGGRRGGVSLDDLFNPTPEGGRGGGGWGGGAWDGVAGGPLTGEEFNRWAERLLDVEQLLDDPELRNAVAAARERARAMRREFRHDLKKPDWAVVRLEVLRPLVEVRSRVADELARRSSRESLAPIDRDPVPNKYAESVRRYYEELGRDN